MNVQARFGEALRRIGAVPSGRVDGLPDGPQRWIVSVPASPLRIEFQVDDDGAAIIVRELNCAPVWITSNTRSITAALALVRAIFEASEVWQGEADDFDAVVYCRGFRPTPNSPKGNR